MSKKLKRVLSIVGAVLVVIGGLVVGTLSIEYKGIMPTEIWSDDQVYNKEEVTTLTKEDGKDFEILLFSDTQLEFSYRKDKATLALVDELVKEVEPDFIMTTGDNVSWKLADIMTQKLIEQMEGYEIPWGVTLGNHDAEGRGDRVWTGNQYMSADYSIFEMGPSNIHGVGNYHVNVEDEMGNILYSLVMLDSNDYREYESGNSYDFIYYDQIKWYEWVVKSVSEVQYGEYDPLLGKVVPSMLFFHIPLPEFEEAAQVNDESVFGENMEKVASAPINSGLFNEAKALQSTTHIFCGHDHINSISAPYEGIRLTYGLKTGPTSYSNEKMQGATLITIKDQTNQVEIEHLYR